MPKMKTHKGAKNRVKITATGKVTAKKPGKRHLNWQKSGKSRRQKGRDFTFAKGEARRVHLLMPYEKKPHSV
ncbi:50S ribosomal protein L35 [Meiothermus rufus]|uniref:50S ribosomal protein L35 n=1 Tax=Meiothermus rufus TaxID=604332 RepID=UPI00041E7536|nr:50S ribosomal protein L35 [Meiothermus rufus]